MKVHIETMHTKQDPISFLSWTVMCSDPVCLMTANSNIPVTLATVPAVTRLAVRPAVWAPREWPVMCSCAGISPASAASQSSKDAV